MTMEPTLTIDKDGTQRWYLDNKFHREDGPAIIRPDGYQAWLLYGRFHREDGPARIWPDGHQVWILNGKRHRIDGPAVILPDKHIQYWAFGFQYSSLEELVVSVIINQ